MYFKIKGVGQLLGVVVLGLTAIYATLFWFEDSSLAQSAGPDEVTAVPSSLNYRGVLRDGQGTLLATGGYTMTFKIYSAVTGGNPLYSDTQTGVAVRDGAFSVSLTGLNNSLFTGSATRYIGVTVDPFAEMAPRQRLASVPYAVKASQADSAGNAGTLDGKDSRDFVPQSQLDGPNSSNIYLGALAGFPDHGRITARDALSNSQASLYVNSLGGGSVDLDGPNGSTNVLLSYLNTDNPNNGQISVRNSDGNTRVDLYVNALGVGEAEFEGPNGSDNVAITYLDDTHPNNGRIRVRNDEGNTRADLYVNSFGAGIGVFDGPNGDNNVALTYYDSTNPNHGRIRVRDDEGNTRVDLYVTPLGIGRVILEGPNGSDNVYMGNYSSSIPDHGAVSVRDASGTSQAGIYVNSSGQGVVWGDTKSFRVPNPNQPGTDIWYASLEGPEAAAYVRGTASLQNGRAEIVLPDHFQAVAIAARMTVQVTPLSAASTGLAVTTKSVSKIVVEELFSGTGSYDFDYTVTAVRQGYEDYQVVRPNIESRQAEVDGSDSAVELEDVADLADEFEDESDAQAAPSSE